MEYKRLTIPKQKGASFRYVTLENSAIADGYDLVINEKCEKVEEVIDRLAELEDKIENGTLIELPCKVGDTVYIITRKRNCSACYFVQDYCHYNCPFKNDKYELVVKEGKISYIKFYRPYPFKPDIGIVIKEDKQLQQEEYDIELWKENDEVFSTKAEAEQKLKELQEQDK